MRKPFKAEVKLTDPDVICFMHSLGQAERNAIGTYLSAIVWHAKLLRDDLDYQPTIVEMLDAAADGHRYVEALIRGGLGSQISEILTEMNVHHPSRFVWLKRAFRRLWR